MKTMGYGQSSISRDLAVVAQLADRIVVMYRGSAYELGSAHELCSPHHPYTHALAAVTQHSAQTGFRPFSAWCCCASLLIPAHAGDEECLCIGQQIACRSACIREPL